jgi:general secretion pathway protein K
VIAKRERAYFRSTADFLSQLPPDAVAPVEDIGVSSAYFMATMHVTIGGAEAHGTALLAREDTRWPAIVWRKLP